MRRRSPRHAHHADAGFVGFKRDRAEARRVIGAVRYPQLARHAGAATADKSQPRHAVVRRREERLAPPPPPEQPAEVPLGLLSLDFKC